MKESRNIKKEIVRYKLLIVDFDGTLVDLRIDWSSLKREFRKIFQNMIGAPLKAKKLKNMFNEIKKKGTKKVYQKIIKKIEDYELRDENYRINSKLVSLINRYNSYNIVIYSMNTRRCINNFISKYKLRRPRMIVSRENAIESKPSGKDINFILNKLNINKNSALMIGNSKDDEDSASLSKIRYFNISF
jgi:phosphoglycolate phosphatase-like HAD superfamily hydrolase